MFRTATDFTVADVVSMTFRLFLAAALLLAGANADTATCSATDQANTKTCLTTYYNHFNVNFTSQTPFGDYMKFCNTYFAAGEQNFETSCTWLNDLDNCFKQKNINVSNCFTTAYFVAYYGDSQFDAQSFVSNYYEQEYTCGDGRKMVHDNWDCLYNVSETDYFETLECYFGFLDATKHNVALCTAYNQYTDCVSYVYTLRCGDVVRPLICNQMEIGLEVVDNECDSVLESCLSKTSTECSDADQATTKKCFTAYFNHWNFTFVNPAPFYLYMMSVNKFFAGGEGNFEKACQWQSDLDTCLSNGKINMTNCFTIEFFQSYYGDNHIDALNFYTSYYENEYSCGDGKQVVHDNFNCLYNVTEVDYFETIACFSNFEDEGNNGIDLCTSYNDYTDCMATVYTKRCGSSVRPYICNEMEIAFKVNDNKDCVSTLEMCSGSSLLSVLSLLVAMLVRFL